VSAPPAFPRAAAAVSKHLKSSVISPDQSFAEIFSTLDRSINNARPIKHSNGYVNADKASSVIILVT